MTPRNRRYRSGTWVRIKTGPHQGRLARVRPGSKPLNGMLLEALVDGEIRPLPYLYAPFTVTKERPTADEEVAWSIARLG